MALNDFSRRGMLGDWIHMFPEGRTYQDQLKCCRDEQGCRFRKSGRKAPPGRDLGPLKWGVGKVISDIIMNGQNRESQYLFKNGINHGKLIVIPYYHLNMEKVMPEDENLKVISFMPRGGNDVFCMVSILFIIEDLNCSSESQLTFAILFKSTQERLN